MQRRVAVCEENRSGIRGVTAGRKGPMTWSPGSGGQTGLVVHRLWAT